jgi:phosphate starvation-inducible PhoH-like protein
MSQTTQKTLSLDDIDPRLIFGMENTHLNLIESELDVDIVARGEWVNIKGTAENVVKAEKVILDIIDHVRATGELNERYILYSIAIVNDNGTPP